MYKIMMRISTPIYGSFDYEYDGVIYHNYGAAELCMNFDKKKFDDMFDCRWYIQEVIDG